MSKFATAAPKPAEGYVETLVVSPGAPDTTTAEGGAGWRRTPKGELFLLALTNFVGEQTFYESADKRDARFESLIATVAADDPAWLARFVPFLRNTMNMRSASLVLAAELVHARLTGVAKADPTLNNRQIVASAISRADEPAEFVGYWRSRFGKSLPMPVRRGVGDALARLLTERSFVKYGSGEGYRIADVIDLVHAEPRAPWQSALYHAILDDRHPTHPANLEVDAAVMAQLPTLVANRAAMAMTGDAFREAFTAEFVEGAALTWEQASSKYGKLDARFWEAMIPNMGIFALVRNLRNFDDAGIGEPARTKVLAKLTDRETIAKSRMLPLRFYSAWANTGTLSWGPALETALAMSLENVPSLPGKTLILVDISGSMSAPLSNRSKATRKQVSALFGSALASRAEHATLVAFESTSHPVDHRRGGSVLRLVDEIERLPSGGTNTWQALQAHYAGHDRVVLLTDEQAFAVGNLYASVWARVTGTPLVAPLINELPDVPIYTWNLAGYDAAHLPSGDKRYSFGGLSDGAFLAIDLIERGVSQGWPF